MRRLFSLLIGLLLVAPSAFAYTSTVDPTMPASDSDLNSDVVRDNFLATYNDINSLALLLSPTTLNANQLLGALTSGPVQGLNIPSCSISTQALGWVTGSGFVCQSFGSAASLSTGSSGNALLPLNGSGTYSGTVNFSGTLQIGGVSSAPSAVIDTTNASNISSGTLANARLATLGANQLLGALATGTPTAIDAPSCSGANNGLTWTTGVGLGCNSYTSATANGGFVTTRIISTGTSDTAGSSDVFIGWASATSGNKSEVLPAPTSQGRVIFLKDELGSVSYFTNNIVVTTSSGTIDNASSYTMSTSLGEASFVADGVSNWMVK
jgi:hypothetical protein